MIVKNPHRPHTGALLNIAVVGHTNTGKTSLIRTMLRSTEFGVASVESVILVVYFISSASAVWQVRTAGLAKISQSLLMRFLSHFAMRAACLRPLSVSSRFISSLPFSASA